MTEEAVHLFQNSSSKSWGEGNPTNNKEEKKLNYDLLTFIFNMKFILIL